MQEESNTASSFSYSLGLISHVPQYVFMSLNDVVRSEHMLEYSPDSSFFQNLAIARDPPLIFDITLCEKSELLERSSVP